MGIQLNTHGIKWRKLIWLLLTNKHFRMCFEEIIFYALVNAEEKRGYCASGVLIFQGHDYEDAIIEKKRQPFIS